MEQADLFFKSKDYEYSKVFYAMYFEHSLNALIQNKCQRRNIEEKMKNDIIRSIDIYGKLTWLPKLLGFKNFNANHLKAIKQLADDRNIFIHYKWKTDPDELPKESELETEFKNIKLAVRYMKSYETNLFFRKSKNKLAAKLKAG